MTGESDAMIKESYHHCVEKREELLEEMVHSKNKEFNSHSIPSPILLSGTEIITGEGEFIVLMVGENSCEGQIMSKLEQVPETTPLQEKLEKIGSDIGKLGMYAALLTIHVLYARFFIEHMIDRNLYFMDNASDYISEWLEYLIVGVAIIVVAVPEGLPLAVMISLAYSVRKMLEEKNFVKRLASCEIMGGATDVCSDKTGTLTENKMTVTDLWCGECMTFEYDKKNPQSFTFDKQLGTKNRLLGPMLAQAISCNTLDEDTAGATEMAMIKLMKEFKAEVDMNALQKKYLNEDTVRFQFSAKRKKMSTILANIEDSETGYPKRIHLKGAAEIVLKSCKYYIDASGHK